MDYRAELIKCANATGGYASDYVSDDFLACVVDEVELLRQERDRLKKEIMDAAELTAGADI
tara:strand:- start:688 stop:870 length:183 start_codon:yes stop_codon:yes gene_type:complete